MTSRLIKPDEDYILPAEFNYGLVSISHNQRANLDQTVLVDRPTAEQSELSTHEMRLNALPFTEKLLRIHPRIVCFVGKKIWDVYESVIKKSARLIDYGAASMVKDEPAELGFIPAEENPNVKEEITDPAAEEDLKPEILDPTTPTPTRAQGTPSRPRTRTPARLKEKFDWTKPRPFRLPHTADNGQVRYTYFWVVPNTSGLERTPVSHGSPSIYDVD